MKKSLLVIAVVLALVITLGAAGFAYAQSQFTPLRFMSMMNGSGASSMSDRMAEHHGEGDYGSMHGMMNGSGPGSMSERMAEHHGEGDFGSMHDMMSGGMMGSGEYGPMHSYMLDALAVSLDLPAEELQARVEAGESMWDIAAGQDLSDEEITTLMQSAHDQAIERALADGAITQEQADWMNDHMQDMHSDGSGGCHGTEK